MSKSVLTNQDLQALGDLMGGLLDKQSAILATKEDLESVRAEMTTKEELNDLKVELKDFMSQGFEAVMGGMDDLVSKNFNLSTKYAKE